jgi:hypothetical protein
MASVAAAALGLISIIVQMVANAKSASDEESADIAARFAAAESALTGAANAAHAELATLERAALDEDKKP